MGLDVVHRAVSARGTPSAEAKRRLQHIEAMFAPPRKPEKHKSAEQKLPVGQ